VLEWLGSRHWREIQIGGAHKMTRWAVSAPISDNEEEDEEIGVGECSNCRHRGVVGTRCPLCEGAGFMHESRRARQEWRELQIQELARARTWRQRVSLGVQRLVRVRKAGNSLPEVGQGCLVLRGDELKDVGQEAIVTKQTAARVHIAYRDRNGRQATRVKHPSSLVLLEDGLHVCQDAHGCIWIKRD
jgi:hypothetical protein